jgi:CRP-like cAMP-binding protein
MNQKAIIRVFSTGATLLEHLKILIGVWTFFVALSVVSFWRVMLLDTDDVPPVLVMDVIVDAVYLLCLAAQLRTSTLDVQSGKENCSITAIWYDNLFGTCFWFDICSCFPLLVVLAITRSSTLTRCTALAKAFRGWRIFRTPPEHVFLPSTIFQLAQLGGMVMMGGHLIACMWFSMVYDELQTMKEHVPEDNLGYKVCLEPLWHLSTNTCWWNLYTVSLHQGMYLLLGIEVNAVSAWEHFFSAFLAPVGALVHAYMLGRIILLIQRTGALETKKNEHTMAVQEAMRILGLTPDLQMRIVTYFTYERIHRSGRLFHDLFQDLSPQLRFELQLQLYLDLVGKSRLFMRTKPKVIREIVTSLDDIIFLPGDWVCRFGDYGDSMYFIVGGQCSVIAQDFNELKVLKDQDSFGEVALLTGKARTASVRANTFCIMAHLTQKSFSPIVMKWPEEVDALLIGVEKEADKTMFRKQAMKHYGLSRRNSLESSNHHTSSSTLHAVRKVSSEREGPAHGSQRSSVTSLESSVESKPAGQDDISQLDSSSSFMPGESQPSISPDLPRTQGTSGRHSKHVTMLTDSPETMPDTQLTSGGAALQRVQTQIAQVFAHVAKLQREVHDQKDMVTKNLHIMKSWAQDATREAVGDHVYKRRTSLNSAMSTGSAVCGGNYKSENSLHQMTFT